MGQGAQRRRWTGQRGEHGGMPRGRVPRPHALRAAAPEVEGGAMLLHVLICGNDDDDEREISPYGDLYLGCNRIECAGHLCMCACVCV